MSLISDALRKARREAALRDARKAELALPGNPAPGRRWPVDGGILLGVAFAGVVAVAAALGAWWALGSGGEAGAPPPRPASAPPATSAPAPSPTPTATASPSPTNPPPAAAASREPEASRGGASAPAPEVTPVPAESAAHTPAAPSPTPTAAPTATRPPRRRSPAARVEEEEPPPLLDVPAGVSGEIRPRRRRRVRPTPRPPSPPRVQPTATPTPRPTTPPRGGAARKGAGSRRTEYTAVARIGSKTLELDYIAYRASDPFAQINGVEVHEGSEIEGFTVVEITPSAVRLADDRGEILLKVR